MFQDFINFSELNACNFNNKTIERHFNTSDINLEAGYKIEVFAQGLDLPIAMTFTQNGEMILAESGLVSGNPLVYKLINNEYVAIADNFKVPITGITAYHNSLYVSQRGSITRIDDKGLRQDIISALNSNGDFVNNNIAIGPDNKIYFGQGTATNSGVVGEDNPWLYDNPLVCDFPGDYIMLVGQNFKTNNITNQVAPGEAIQTGAFSPYGIPNLPYELRKGYVKASGSILRANLDGTKLELYAWGFRNPVKVRFNTEGKLYVSNQGYDNRGSRPIVNAPDEFFEVSSGLWYGWPDFSGGEPVTNSRFRPIDAEQPAFLIKNHPNDAPLPFTTFPTNSNIMGFDFNYNRNFGNYGNAFIAEFGYYSKVAKNEEYRSFSDVGNRISKIDMNNKTVSTFALNKSGFPAYVTGEGGFGRLSDVEFGPDGSMYVLDYGLSERDNPTVILPKSGAIWRITKV